MLTGGQRDLGPRAGMLALQAKFLLLPPRKGTAGGCSSLCALSNSLCTNNGAWWDTGELGAPQSSTRCSPCVPPIPVTAVRLSINEAVLIRLLKSPVHRALWRKKSGLQNSAYVTGMIFFFFFFPFCASSSIITIRPIRGALNAALELQYSGCGGHPHHRRPQIGKYRPKVRNKWR